MAKNDENSPIEKATSKLSVQELMKQEAAKRRSAMGYDEEDVELEEDIEESVTQQPELSVQELMKQEAAKRRSAMGYDEEDEELEEDVGEVEANVETETVVQVQTSTDSVIFGPKNNPTLSVSVSDTVDPITAAIREEIIKKQQQLLQTEIANGMEDGPEKESFKKQDLTALRAYLATEEGKEAAAKVMKTPEMQTKMHAIEQTGYKAVHSQFQDSFRNVDWGAGASKTRTTNIKNENGEDVCSLKETTVDTAPTSLMLEDGTTRTVKSYRQIDFPKGLEADHGPLHLSMALKDENGRNMPESSAVYFTAHYDESGKLTEVSSPVPVKFMGEGPDAIGYIERNGKVYTLPVTQEKYHEMMQEVAKNHGMNVDISQTIETTQELSHDQVVTPPQHSGEEITQPPKEKPVKPVVNTPLSSNEMEQQLEAQKKKLKPVGDRVLNDAPEQPESLEQQLEAQKAKLKPAGDRVLNDAPEQPETLAQQLEAQKAKLKPAQKRKLNPKPEQPKTMTLLDELRRVAEGEISPNGNLVPSKVIKKVQTIRNNVEGKQKQVKVAKVHSQEVNISADATKMLTGKTDKEAQKIITKAAKEGKIDLVAAMVDAVSKETPANNIPKVEAVKLAEAYTDAMVTTKTNPNKAQKARIERACGKIAEKTPHINHTAQMSSRGAKASR